MVRLARKTNEDLERRLETLQQKYDDSEQRRTAKIDELTSEKEQLAQKLHDRDSQRQHLMEASRENVKLENQIQKLADENDVLKNKVRELSKAKEREDKLKWVSISPRPPAPVSRLVLVVVTIKRCFHEPRVKLEDLKKQIREYEEITAEVSRP